MRVRALGQIIMDRLNIEQSEKLIETMLSDKTSEVQKKKPQTPRKILFPVPRLYINSINKIVKTMKEANIDCETVTNRVGEYYEYTIKIHSAAEV